MAAATAMTDSATRAQSGQSWFTLIKQTGADWMEDKAMRLAAALALYIILSLAPLLVIAVKVLFVFTRDPKTAQKVQQQVVGVVGQGGGEAIGVMIQRGSDPKSGIVATVISFAILLFSASGVFGELQDSLNTIWEVKVKPDQGWWEMVKNRFLSLAMVFVIAFLLMVSLIVSTVLAAVSQKLAGGAGWLSFVIDIVVSVVVSTGLFTALFRVLPDVKIGWRDVLLGAFVTAVLFKLGQYGLALYFKFAAPASTYGAFGSIVAVLLWAYYSSMILFFGAEFTQAYAKREGRWIEPADHAVSVTEEERAQQGMPSRDAVRAKAAERETGGKPGGGTQLFDPLRRPIVVKEGSGAPMKGKDYALAVGGAVVGVVLGGLGVEYMLNDPKKPSKRHVAAVRLNERLHQVEQKLGRVSRIKDYLEDMDVKQRIDRVEKEIRRAGTHVRAKETGRPAWAVRLANWVGGRWSSL